MAARSSAASALLSRSRDACMLGQNEREALPRGRLHGGEQVRPGVVLVTQAWRALASGKPTVAHAPFLAETGLVLEIER